MADIKFRKVSNSLVEVLYDDVMNIISIEEAIQMGYIEFTYQGEAISASEFAKLSGIPYNRIRYAISRYKYSTGEEIIEYYRKLENNQLTYQGKSMSIMEFARIIGETYPKIYKIAYKSGYRTGEEIIQFLKEQTKRDFTYKREKITVTSFARLIGKKEGTIDDIVRKHGYKTGEEVLQYLQARPEKREFTYQGKEITKTEFAKLINKSAKSVLDIVNRHNLNTGEELIAYYKKHTRIIDIFTYQGKHITYSTFGEIINKPVKYIQYVINYKGFTTGEEIIAYIAELDSHSLRFTFKNQPISRRQFSKQMGISADVVRRCYEKYNCRTGEEVIEHLKMRGKL